MQAVERLAVADRGGVVDAGLGIAGAGLTAIAAWGAPRLIGSEAVAGPAWLVALLPLVLGGALTVRRRAPLLMWLAIWAALGLLCLLGPNSVRGLAFTFVVFTAAYSLGAYADSRLAAAGLALTAPVVVVLADKGELALTFSQGQGSQKAVLLAVLQLLACWLAGAFVQARRRAEAQAARSAALRRQAQEAVAAERARIARELHDSVAHHLSVIVLQAAGTRASGKAPETALEKIELSARQALTETRRLLGVLRDPDEETLLGPRPGIAELDELVASVRAAGLTVNLVVRGDYASLPAAVDVSVYRIVQESLTNVLKHAGPACADVTVGCATDGVLIEVADNGTGEPADEVLVGGHGLAGMRERAAVFGGELAAGPRPGGGFAVRAQLPLNGGLLLSEPS